MTIKNLDVEYKSGSLQLADKNIFFPKIIIYGLMIERIILFILVFMINQPYMYANDMWIHSATIKYISYRFPAFFDLFFLFHRSFPLCWCC